MLQGLNGNPQLPQVIEEAQTHRGLSVQRMPELGRVSRSSFYRFHPDGKPDADRDMELRDAIQRIALEWPSYRRPGITAQLRRQGWRVNPKRVYRLMREDNLLCLRRRKFVITTGSNHSLPVYPNRAARAAPTGLDQLWVADITYLRLELEFVYLAVILDAFSRRVLGWAPDRTLQAKLTLEALRMTLPQRKPAPGLVHHSDRGVQYASRDYTDLLKENAIVISMSRAATPRQCHLRVVPQDPQVRGGVSDGISRPGRGPGLDRHVSGKGL